MKRFLLPILLGFTTICFAQKRDMRVGEYHAYLYSVEVPKNFTAGSIDSTSSVYEDSLIKIDWGYATSQIGFELTNKADQTLKVIWDDAAFISTTNESDRIFHKGVKYIDRENSQPPSSVYKGTTLSDLVSPTSYTYFASGQYGGWRSKPLIPVSPGMLSSKIEYKPELLGQTMKVVLPIKIDEKVIEYIFHFRTDFLEKSKK